MKNKPYPALLRPSNLSNEMKKRISKSRETIPVRATLLVVISRTAPTFLHLCWGGGIDSNKFFRRAERLKFRAQYSTV
jgi:hypothetical protein